MMNASHSNSTSPLDTSFGIVRVAFKGMSHYRRMLWPVALGVAAATAVIVGALLVGDSVRGSLRFLALDRLGKIELLLLAPRFFDEAALEKWNRQTGFPSQRIGHAQPAIVFHQARIERSKSGRSQDASLLRSGNAQVLGITSDFWSLGQSMPVIDIGGNEVVLNEALARDLDVAVGDKLTLRLPAQTAVPADSPLGRRDTETVNMPGLTLIRIIPDRSLGRFDLRSNQRPSKNAFLSIRAIQNALDREGQINAAFLPQAEAVDSSPIASDRSIAAALLDSLPLTLADMGYTVTHVERRYPEPSLGEAQPSSTIADTKIFDYYQVTSDQLLLPGRVERSVRELWPGQASSSVLTYLANGIQKVSEAPDALSVPYSTISAIDPAILSTASIGFPDPSLNDLKGLADDDVLINAWLANRLKAKVGERIQVEYFLPETVDGREVEQSFTARIAAVVPLTEPRTGYERKRAAKFDRPPTVFNDPFLTPDVPGITDQASISDWDLPFALTRTIDEEDDDYWTNHRLTPKLFLPLARGQQLFGSRFGSVSSIRISSASVSTIDDIENKLAAAIRPLISELGWQLMPLREQQLAAARGTTPFDMLFLALSFFVILAALILVALLFRLGIERRASHWGLLLSLGWPLRKVRSLLFIEGLGLASFGSLLGLGLGALYAYGVLALLKSWWIGAVGAPFLTFFVTPRSLLVGLAAGLLMAGLTIWFATRFLARQSMVRLLRGRVETPSVGGQRRRSWYSVFAIGCAIATLGITVLGLFLNGQAAGGAFVGAGMTALVGMLLETTARLRPTPLASIASGNDPTEAPRPVRRGPSSATLSLQALATSSIRRNPTRTALAIGLVSVATLLILSMSLFEAVPDAQGTGGFQLVAETSVPIAKSLSDSDYLRETLGEQSAVLRSASIISIRVRDGDDAGCNNLYQASQPRVLGISPSIVTLEVDQKSRDTFAWAASAAPLPQEKGRSRWQLLERDGDGSRENPFPVVIDQNTALWALHLTGGVGQQFAYTFGSKEIHFKTVGLLQNTILQGSLMLGEKNFKQAFPNISGYRSWLVQLPPSQSVSEATSVLETGWADEGLDAFESDSVLRNLLAVQNTYLKAFQSLGALGLLLGTFGLAVVQLRSVMERQAEFGLLRAIGFTRSRIGRLILLESITLLVAGLGIGVLAAAVALLPTIFRGGIRPNALAPLAMLSIVALFGVAASLLAVRRAMKLKLLQAIRSD